MYLSSGLFREKDIINRLPISGVKDITTEDPELNLQIRYTRNNKAIIQQETIFSCAPTCIAMLLMDNNKTPDWRTLKYNSERGYTKEMIEKKLKKANVEVIKTDNIIDLRLLKQAIKDNGSAICFLCGHAIIVDNINEANEVTLRDPQEGREITVTGDNFIDTRNLHMWSRNCSIFQIKNVN